MKTTVNLYDFRREFQAIRPNNFSYEGLEILFNYFEQLEQDCEKEIEMDVIAICCDFSEDHYKDVANSYDISLDHYSNEEEELQAVLEHLTDHGYGYCGVTEENNIIYQQF